MKKIAHELLEKLEHELLVLDWKKRQQTRAAVQVAIEQQLDSLPDVYYRDTYKRKCSRVFEPVFRGVPGRRKEHLRAGRGVISVSD